MKAFAIMILYTTDIEKRWRRWSERNNLNHPHSQTARAAGQSKESDMEED
jgi:hypothetical protein